MATATAAMYRCVGTTKTGSQCNRKVKVEGSTCGLNHQTTVRASLSDIANIDSGQQDPFATSHPQVDWEQQAEMWREKAREATALAKAGKHPSLWPPELQAELYELRAKICDQQGKWTFTGLYSDDDENPVRINARVRHLRTGVNWMVFNPSDNLQIGQAVRHIPMDSDQLKHLGLVERPEDADAWARISIPKGQPTDGEPKHHIEVYRVDGDRPFRPQRKHPAAETGG